MSTNETEEVIRTRNSTQLETIENTLRRAGVDYRVYREHVVEIETQPEEVIDYPSEGTMDHDILVELAELYPTSMTARSLSGRIDRASYSTSAQCSSLHADGFLNREKVETDNTGKNPYAYQLREEFVDALELSSSESSKASRSSSAEEEQKDILDSVVVEEESSGLAELFG